MPTLSYVSPVVGNSIVTEDALVADDLIRIKNEYNSNIPNLLGQPKPLTQWWAQAIGAGFISTGTLHYPAATTNTIGLALQSSNTPVVPADVFYYDPADYAIAGYTIKFFLKYTLLVNGTAPAANISPELRSIASVGGTAGNTSVTLSATPLEGSITFFTPAANSINVRNSPEFVIPSAVYLIPDVVTSAVPPGANGLIFGWQLYYRYV